MEGLILFIGIGVAPAILGALCGMRMSRDILAASEKAAEDAALRRLQSAQPLLNHLSNRSQAVHADRITASREQ